jgi:hypothetical protein
METVHFSEILASARKSTWFLNQEERHHYCHSHANLKSHKIVIVSLPSEWYIQNYIYTSWFLEDWLEILEFRWQHYYIQEGFIFGDGCSFSACARFTEGVNYKQKKQRYLSSRP